MIKKDKEICVSLTLLRRIYDEGLTLDEFAYMYSRSFSLGWTKFFKHTLPGLEERNLLRKNLTLSAEGQKILNKLLEVELTSKEQLEEEFNEFWEEFPDNDAIHHHVMTRPMKNPKNLVRTIYTKTRKEYSHDEIMKGLRAQLQHIQLNSFKENKLTFMKNIGKWLLEKDFLLWNNSNSIPTIDPAQTRQINVK
jgi:hypothetical protein